jgi:hypothetical protein
MTGFTYLAIHKPPESSTNMPDASPSLQSQIVRSEVDSFPMIGSNQLSCLLVALESCFTRSCYCVWVVLSRFRNSQDSTSICVTDTCVICTGFSQSLTVAALGLFFSTFHFSATAYYTA